MNFEVGIDRFSRNVGNTTDQRCLTSQRSERIMRYEVLSTVIWRLVILYSGVDVSDEHTTCIFMAAVFFCGEGPRSRCYGRTAALRLMVQPSDEEDRFFFSFFRVMEQRWNEIDRGKLKYSGKNLSQCHFVHHKSQWTDPGSNRGTAMTAVTRLCTYCGSIVGSC
jgi:hypothetical protein